MFDPILVPLDGSPFAESAVPQAAAISQAFNAKIMLLHILDRGRVDPSTQVFDLLNWQIKKMEAKLYLERMSDRLQKSSLQTEAIVLEGPVAESITKFAQSQDMKLVILSSHGQSGLRKWGISSITNKIIFSAPTSVLIVRAPRLEEKPFSRILVPLDCSWRAENVLPMVTLLARFHKSQIQIAHVVKTTEMARHLPPVQEDIDLSNRIVARNREEALHYLDQVQLHSSLAGIDVKAHLIVSNNVTLALHELVEREQIDMVALSAHGYSGNNQWPYGNVVNNFILYSKVPLLIVQDMPLKEEPSQVYMPVREESRQAYMDGREQLLH